ncbi:N-acetyltransferase 6 isoform X2 [Cephus cinctus]|uniref:N-acetyltransferase 6 isoform X2 n=1 Tax=Cephus cinctus TaxID=211228 RepID=A0AAJ7C4I5_CEPCN|nr:N-acetyltransferase 6 isoform X2 [Cephus cinctus]
MRTTMKESQYCVVPLHSRPEMIKNCCILINSEWPRSETARLRTLNMSCDDFPTCLILLNGDRVVGHCKISLISSMSDSCFIESVVIDYERRSQGLGSILMQGAEEYVAKKGIKNIYLTTRGQEQFYLKNGYNICEPINLYGYTSFITSSPMTKEKARYIVSAGPPPPPMPINVKKPHLPIVSAKTYMVKKL